MNQNLIWRYGIGMIAALSIVGITSGSSVKADTSVYIPETGKPVHYNWGWGSPAPGVGSDHFTSVFDQSGNYAAGDYFLQTFADDGVKVEADGKTLINRWSDYTGKVDRALWLGVSGGQHTVKTHYLENVASAAIYSDVVPFGSWLAYYYPNDSLAGMPTAAKVISPTDNLKKLSEDFGTGTPDAGINPDHFSAKYTTAKRITAGEYILRAKADDGIRVYVDGTLVIDRWNESGGYREDSIKLNITDNTDGSTGEKDVHWVNVEYYDSVAGGKVEFSLEPFSKAIDNSWVGEVYPNKNFQGTPTIIGGENANSPIPNLNFDWGWNGSPHPSIPADSFSARFTKKMTLEAGTYMFTANGDDGVRVKLDGETIIDAWPNTGFQDQKKQVNVTAGKHTITVEYLEDVGRGFLSFDFQRFGQLPVQIEREVRHNWGWGNPANGVAGDYFTADFDQSGDYAAGDYFLQAFADDGVKVEADGETLINRWSDYTGKADRALWLDVTGGQHTVKTHYLENVASAAIYSDVVPLGSWLAYYYPNESLSGMPNAAKVINPTDSLKKLSEDFGSGSPAAGINSDHFSAKYTTAKRIQAGEYILRAKADDGIRVYVDGKLVIDRWKASEYLEESIKLTISDRPDANTGEKDVHWIDVEYLEQTGNGKVEVSIESFAKAIDNSWIGELYPNKSFQGTPYVIGGMNALNPISSINFNWGWTGSPHPAIPADGFTARFTKMVSLEAGTYVFTANGDDGVRVKLDDKTIIEAWPNTGSVEQKKQVEVDGGTHTITVEYLEDVALASLSFNYQRMSQLPIQVEREVHHNWGWGSPANGVLGDYFTADFDQSGNYIAGDYFLQAFADDGVKVETDGKTLINRWSDYTGKADRALWLSVTGGQHTVKTHYLENVASAAIYSDVVPFGSWLAYYYPNESLSGMPTVARVITPTDSLKKLSEEFGSGSPDAGINPDHFSAKYTTAQRITAGEYILRAKADDGIRVYVDGKLVVDRWTASEYREDSIKLTISDRSEAKAGEQDVHWIDVEYLEQTGNGKVEVLLEPFSPATVNNWIGEVYQNKSLEGSPIIIGGGNSMNPINTINFNWGSTEDSPHPSITGDNFSMRLTKKVQLDTGTYLFTAKADDGMRVLLDGQVIMDYWQNYDFSEKRYAQYIESGQHTITVEYYENVGNANLSFDMRKLSSTKVYYEQSQNVQTYWGAGSPVNFPAEGFEAVFDQSGSYSGGDYFLQTFADDGVKVEVDGQLLINRWTDYTGQVDRGLWLGVGSGNHSIQTYYYDNVSSAGVFSHVVPFNSWLAYYYSNESLSGFPAAAKVLNPVGSNKALSENFLNNSPTSGLPNDHFSARYTTAKRITAGTYLFKAKQDDGVRVYVDGKLVIDDWNNGGVREQSARVTISNRADAPSGQQDIHWIEVEYYDSESVGSIDFSIEPLVGPIYLSTSYNYTLNQMVETQMKTIPQTDLHSKYLREDALVKNASGTWVVNGGWNVRGGPGTDYPIVGTINSGIPVTIVNTFTTPGQPTWYQVSAWINALNSDVLYYVNPTNFAKGSTEYFQFLKLSESAGLNIDEVNNKILSGKGILQGKASSFIEAGTKLGINEVYLISHALLETGNGTSDLAKGVLVSSVDGQAVEPKVVYNMYGINAKDSCPTQCGSEYAYKMGWTTPELAIVGGAEFIASSYIKKGQDTLYKMRWNPAAPGTHQYASDIGWAVKQVNKIKNLYDILSNYILVFEEPKYQ
ncbi:PA14 domain-containing protein [Neobacillus sp. Marseille-QA0830]